MNYQQYPSKHVLPIEPPDADSCCEMAMLFSILKTNSSYIPWLLNNFIQIYSLHDLYKVTPEVKRGTLNFFYNIYGDWSMYELTANPCLDFEKISFSSFQNSSIKIDLISYLQNQLLCGKYIYSGYDKYYISGSESYQKEHAGHTFFINGYTPEGFIAHDNFINGKYKELIIPYDEILCSFESIIKNKKVANEANLSGLCCIKPKENFRNQNVSSLFQLNLDLICTGIQEYLMNPNYCQRYNKISFFQYGINCYEELIKFVQNPSNFIDWRAFCYMLDHKKVMSFRLKYIANALNINLNSEIQNYNIIIQKLRGSIFNILKYNITLHNSILFKIENTLIDLKHLEISTLNSGLNKLTNYAVEKEYN